MRWAVLSGRCETRPSWAALACARGEQRGCRLPTWPCVQSTCVESPARLLTCVDMSAQLIQSGSASGQASRSPKALVPTDEGGKNFHQSPLPLGFGLGPGGGGAGLQALICMLFLGLVLSWGSGLPLRSSLAQRLLAVSISSREC